MHSSIHTISSKYKCGAGRYGIRDFSELGKKFQKRAMRRHIRRQKLDKEADLPSIRPLSFEHGQHLETTCEEVYGEYITFMMSDYEDEDLFKNDYIDDYADDYDLEERYVADVAYDDYKDDYLLNNDDYDYSYISPDEFLGDVTYKSAWYKVPVHGVDVVPACDCPKCVERMLKEDKKKKQKLLGELLAEVLLQSNVWKRASMLSIASLIRSGDVINSDEWAGENLLEFVAKIEELLK